MEPTRHPRVVSGTKAEGALIAPLVEFAAAAVRNDRVDPITTELVRLTCARYHDCHTWLSLRSAVAKQHGLDEDLVSQLGAGDPDLTDAQVAAVDFAHALMTDPAGISNDLRTRLRDHYSVDQIIELSLDVMKWSYQKVAVALGVDREIIPGQLTDLVFDEDGHWVRPG